MRFEDRVLCDRSLDENKINPEFEMLLAYLKQHWSCDFTHYRRSSLMRRFQYRMQKVGVSTYAGYFQRLQEDSEEYPSLLEDVLINVTTFFRDHDTWHSLAMEVIPRMIASKPFNQPICIWSAGCATGQEIYSALILLAEALGTETFLRRVHCFATDVDEAALLKAQQATYNSLEVANVPPQLLQKYFEQTEQGYVFHPMFRRTVIFSRHDLTQDEPIAGVDLIICRNVLIYFNSRTQSTILNRLYSALNPMGLLVLGRTETLTHHSQIFTPFNLHQKIYTKGLELA